MIIPVKVVSNKQGSTLIQWVDDDGYHRGYVPEEVIHDNMIDSAALSLVIPYGMDWEYLVSDLLGKVTPHTLSESLHKAGIWTLHDLYHRPQDVRGAIQAVYALDYNVLVRTAEQFEKDTGGNK